MWIVFTEMILTTFSVMSNVATANVFPSLAPIFRLSGIWIGNGKN